MVLSIATRRSVEKAPVLLLSCVLGLCAGSAWAVDTFRETFEEDAAGWLGGDRGALVHHAVGGADGSGYVSFETEAFNSGTGGFGDPLKLMFRGNESADASGGAFVGDWLKGGIESFRVTIRHDHAAPLNLFVRLAGSFGAGASLANASRYSIPPNAWKTITIRIDDADPPFVSYGTSRFTGVFSRIKTIQIGFYLPEKADFSALRMDLDEVAIVAAPPPFSAPVAIEKAAN